MLRFLTKSVNKYSFSSFKTAQKSLLGVSASEQSSATGHQKIDEKTADIQITKLPNGIRVVTQSTTIPSTVQLGLYLDVGTRNETPETSGSLYSIQNTYLKTVLNTNETVNYGVHQMSGGDFEMFYDREFSFFRGSCLAHDTVDVFRMMVDCALEPRSAVAANVGMDKNTHGHKLSQLLGGNDTYNDAIHAVAFGGKSLGNALKGNKNNIENLTFRTLQKFQKDNFSADRIVILGAGIDNHNQFVELVQDKLSEIHVSNEGKHHGDNSPYVGGEVKTLTDSKTTHVTLAFEGLPFHKSLPLLIAKSILHDSNSQNGRLFTNVLRDNVYVDSAQAFSHGYTETGLFGVKLSGSSAHVNNVFENAVNSLKNLQNIKKGQFESARSALNRYIHQYWQFPRYRLEYYAKNLKHSETVKRDYQQQINNVTLEDVQQAVSTALKSKPTIVVQGGNTYKLNSYDEVANAFK